MKKGIVAVLLAGSLLSGGCYHDLSFVEQLAVFAGEMVAWEAFDAVLEGPDKEAIEKNRSEQEERERSGDYRGP